MRVWGPGRAAEGSPREVVGVPRPVLGAPCLAGRRTCPGSVHVVRRCDPRCDRGRDAGRDRGCDPGRMCGRGGAGGGRWRSAGVCWGVAPVRGAGQIPADPQRTPGRGSRAGSVVTTVTGPRAGGTDRRGGAMGPRGLAGCPSKASTDTCSGNCRLGLREAGVIRLGRSPERPGRAPPGASGVQRLGGECRRRNDRCQGRFFTATAGVFRGVPRRAQRDGGRLLEVARGGRSVVN